MTERERLTKLIINAPKLEFPFGSRAQGKTYQTAQNIADHLLANGVIVPPCKLGDTVYVVFGNGIIECIVAQITIEPYAEIQYSFHCYGGMTFDMRFFGDSVFLTKEEAEKALAERSNNEM
jgi:hypothetical protein